MTLRHDWFNLALLGCLLLVLMGSASSQGTTDIKLKRLADNSCTQNDLKLPVNVPIGNVVHWFTEPLGQPFTVRFLPGGTPFETFRAPAGSVNSGPTSGQKDDTYPYANLTINGSKCNNLSQLGIIMR